MRSLPKLALVPCLALVLPACAPPESETETAEPAAETTVTDEAAVREALQARIDAYEQAALAGDFEGTKMLWTDDIRIREPGFSITGSAEMSAFYDELTASGMKVQSVDIRTDEVFVHGDVAYTIGDYDETVQPGADAEPMTFHNHWFARWELGADGTWRIDRLMTGPVDAPEGMGPQAQ